MDLQVEDATPVPVCRRGISPFSTMETERSRSKPPRKTGLTEKGTTGMSYGIHYDMLADSAEVLAGLRGIDPILLPPYRDIILIGSGKPGTSRCRWGRAHGYYGGPYLSRVEFISTMD